MNATTGTVISVFTAVIAGSVVLGVMVSIAASAVIYSSDLVKSYWVRRQSKPTMVIRGNNYDRYMGGTRL